MKNTFSVLFFPRKNNSSNAGETLLYMRITINGRRTEISTHRKVVLEKWDSKAGKLRGIKSEIREFNNYLDFLRAKVYKAYKRLEEEGSHITPQTVKNEYLGIRPEDNKMLLEIFKNHNDQLMNLVGKEYSLGTIKKYTTTYKHVKKFIAKKYKLKDLPVKDLDYQFITDFEYFLKTAQKCNHNTALKYIKNFKKIVLIALANNWIDKDPFRSYKARIKEVKREFLTIEEINNMMEKKFIVPRLEQVRDIFVFCCYTGLSYSDVKKLSKDNLVIGIDGETWVKVNRTKTDTRSSIPLLPAATEIIKKYERHEDVIDNNILLPVLSNQKSNAYLKEIADVCGINKNLTTHLARHTFATTITLSNGVPIESVSKMLGHKSLRTTQHYAKILDRKVSEDMAVLKSKLKKDGKQFTPASNK